MCDAQRERRGSVDQLHAGRPCVSHQSHWCMCHLQAWLQHAVRPAMAPRRLCAAQAVAAASRHTPSSANMQQPRQQPQHALWLGAPRQQRRAAPAPVRAADEDGAGGSDGGDASGGLISAALLAIWAGLLGGL